MCKEEILESFAGNNMNRLKKICNPMIKRIGGISQKDYDDLYDIALIELWKATEKYDDKRNDSFDAYMINNIKRKYMSYMTYINRKKRIPMNQIISYDALIENFKVK